MSVMHDLTVEKMYERILNLKAHIEEITSVEEIDTNTLLVNGNTLVTFDKHQNPNEIQKLEGSTLGEFEVRQAKGTSNE